ncbi:MAG: response regulator [Geothrix sp.]|jgi:CheY-like chemotaxis protein|uniref:Response regulator n=1 Tax=Candidatus Geothrix odensensis TaxID=2954440 RepID=A0A936F2I6_9BACT|nr:response regulator [Holophagaceae bacterium]MBK8572440.1 response regulator [Candidatus Geothrix odensensis]MCC6514020.1 response regulator [Geothrix sp.]
MNLPTRPRPMPLPEVPTKTLMVVEDDRATLSLYRAGLKGLQGFKIIMAENGGQALEMLRQEPVHVLVTDLNMPVMDGFNLIAKVSRLYPQVPIIVMTGLDESQHLNTPLQLGAIRILTKPPRLTLLMDAIRAAAQFEPAGMVRGIGLNSILQLLNWEKKSCTLTVKSEAGMGLLYLKLGEVVHAAYRADEGLPAAYEILCWDKPDIEFVETCRVEPSIDLPLTELLMNAAMISDHRNPEFGEA